MPDKDIVREVIDRFKEASDAVETEYQEALADLTFVAGDQWPGDIKAQRESDGRPCLTINKVAVFADGVIGDIRQNEPMIKVKPVDSEGDVKTAEIFTGLIKNIEVQSDAEIAYDTAAESAVICGYGAFRISTEYADDKGFDQNIVIRRIKNPFTVMWDPGAQAWDKSDARYCIVTERVPKDQFQADYPDASLIPFEGSKDTALKWGDDKSIRVAEYWKKEVKRGKLYLCKGNDPLSKETFTFDRKPEDKENWTILKERDTETVTIKWWKVTQSEVLEGPVEWPGRYIPICSVFGKEINIEGKSNCRGVTRFAKDPQRLYNYSRSTAAEVTSLAPKSPYLVTAKMIGNYQKIWDASNRKNFAYLPYDVDPASPSLKPERQPPIQSNSGITEEIMISDQEIHDTTGLQQASLGQRSNEKSGKAILARQREGDVQNYAFYDNLGRAIKYAGKVLVDLIPKIYDTARIIRILNEDGSDEQVPINQPVVNQSTGVERIFDLGVGQYDVVVTIGPSYSTQREEAADGMMALVSAAPQIIPIMGDLLVKNLDWPGAQEMEKRLKMMLPPQLQEGQQGQPPPQAPPPPPPDPKTIMDAKLSEEKAKGQAIDNEIKYEQLKRLKQGLPMEPVPPPEPKDDESGKGKSKKK